MPSLKALKNRFASVIASTVAGCLLLVASSFVADSRASDSSVDDAGFENSYRSLVGEFDSIPFGDLADVGANDIASLEAMAFTLVREFRPGTHIGFQSIREKNPSESAVTELYVVISEDDYETKPAESQSGLFYKRRVIDTFTVNLKASEIANLIESIRADGIFDEASDAQKGNPGCIHAAHFYFEAWLNGERKLISRTGCASEEFRDDLRFGRRLVLFAAEKIPAAKDKLAYALELVGSEPEAAKPNGE